MSDGNSTRTVLHFIGEASIMLIAAKGSHIFILFLGWLSTFGFRLATGSATVATVTAAAGIVVPLGHSLDRPDLAVLVLAVGSGSLFFSHVDDAGSGWVKEYLKMTVWETITSWSVMETVISVVALPCVLLLGAIV